MIIGRKAETPAQRGLEKKAEKSSAREKAKRVRKRAASVESMNPFQ